MADKPPTLLDVLTQSLERVVAKRSPPDEGEWVVVATVEMASKQRYGVPLMGSRIHYCMRRFATAEEAIANSAAFPAARVGGGWCLNLRTGETVPIHPFRGHPTL